MTWIFTLLHALNPFGDASGDWHSIDSDRDGTATAAANEDLPVPKDCQARAEGIAP